MPKGYNSLNNIKTNYYEIGMCPACGIRLTHGCEHSQNMLAQEWLAAQIVAEQELQNEKTTVLECVDTSAAPLNLVNRVFPSAEELDKRVKYDFTPTPSDMPVIDFDGVKEIPF